MQLRIQRAWLPGARQDLGSFDSEFVVGGIYHYYLQEQTKGSCDNLGARALSLDTIDKSETGSSFISLLVSVALHPGKANLSKTLCLTIYQTRWQGFSQRKTGGSGKLRNYGTSVE
jgi:hypothetical protein